MGGYSVKSFPAMTISTSGGVTNSNSITFIDDCYALALMTSSLTNTVSVQVEPTSTGLDFVNLISGGAIVTLVASGAIVVSPSPFRQLRVQSASTEAAARTVTAVGTIIV